MSSRQRDSCLRHSPAAEVHHSLPDVTAAYVTHLLTCTTYVLTCQLKHSGSLLTTTRSDLVLIIKCVSDIPPMLKCFFVSLTSSIPYIPTISFVSLSMTIAIFANRSNFVWQMKPTLFTYDRDSGKAEISHWWFVPWVSYSVMIYMYIILHTWHVRNVNTL